MPLQCRDGWYLLDGDCVQSCPSERASSGVGLFKRRCAVPFLCQSARLVVDPPVNYGCKCATEGNTAIADCQICEHRASECKDSRHPICPYLTSMLCAMCCVF